MYVHLSVQWTFEYSGVLCTVFEEIDSAVSKVVRVVTDSNQ